MSLTYINVYNVVCMNAILNMMSALYSFVIKPFSYH